MRKRRQMCMALFCSISMVFLIFNAKFSLEFATEGIKLCIESLIPSLFPFMFLAVLLNSALNGCCFRLMQIVSTLCHIPKGSEMLFLLGILGGYPIGAQVIANTVRSGNLKKQEAERMLGFCNNAGPSFIFGVIGPLFPSAFVPALIWLIQILSAIITGMLVNGNSTNTITVPTQSRISVTDALEKAVKTMGMICGWTILFRIMVGFLELWLRSRISKEVLIVITGFLELTNGSVGLQSIRNRGIRFVLANLFLSVGGLCVTLQTASAAKGLNMKGYLTGKCLQALISASLAFMIQQVIFDAENRIFNMPFGGIIGILIVILVIIFTNYKKTVAFPEKVVYN